MFRYYYEEKDIEKLKGLIEKLFKMGALYHISPNPNCYIDVISEIPNDLLIDHSVCAIKRYTQKDVDVIKYDLTISPFVVIGKPAALGKTENLKPGQIKIGGTIIGACSSNPRWSKKEGRSMVDTTAYTNACMEMLGSQLGKTEEAFRSVLDRIYLEKQPRHKIQLNTVDFFEKNNNNTTVVTWYDGTKTAVRKSKSDTDDKTKAFLMAYFQKKSGLNKTQANKLLKEIANGEHSTNSQGEIENQKSIKEDWFRERFVFRGITKSEEEYLYGKIKKENKIVLVNNACRVFCEILNDKYSCERDINCPNLYNFKKKLNKQGEKECQH